MSLPTSQVIRSWIALVVRRISLLEEHEVDVCSRGPLRENRWMGRNILATGLYGRARKLDWVPHSRGYDQPDAPSVGVRRVGRSVYGMGINCTEGRRWRVCGKRFINS